MRLIKVGLQSYKRFREPHEMDVDSKLIAIVGPNEAGKTSLLQALSRHLNGDRQFTQRELTRNADDPRPSVWARYALDDDDRAVLAKQVPEAKEARQLIITADSDGDLNYEIEEAVLRDLEPRTKALAALNRVFAGKWLKDNDDETETLVAALVTARGVLELDKQNLTDLAPLYALVQLLASYELSPSVARLRTKLEALIKQEEVHPHDAAVEILDERRPRFLFFDSGSRQLRSSYSLDEEHNKALDNFLALAGTSWDKIHAVQADEGKRTAMEERADELLDEAFDSWQQSELIVRLRVRERTVNIQVRMHAAHDYVGVQERSDGLRQFIALRAYIKAEEVAAPPVLLIDEAEAHLHYDAQADLVDVFAKQEDAARVIYTTHSAGCLPPDLGTGVRMVVPMLEESEDREPKHTDDSEIINWFWTAPDAGPGFTPLLIGMGAATFAFASTRRALTTEGASDAILLPTLFREVIGREQLDFQVALGLGNLTDELADELDLIAARVAHLVDGDKGGSDRRKHLRRLGIPNNRIFSLGGPSSGLVLEDLVRHEAYLAGVNHLLKTWNTDLVMPASALPKTKRHAAVVRWCEKQPGDVSPPGKRAIAHAIVEIRHERKLVAGNRRATLRSLHNRIDTLLKKRPKASS